jgi:hypothetical protein
LVQHHDRTRVRDTLTILRAKISSTSCASEPNQVAAASSLQWNAVPT